MKTAARVFVIGALVALLLAAGSAWADSHVRIVRLSYLQGDVSIDLGQGAGSQRAVINMPIIEGAKVWTGNDGQAEVEFEDGSSIRIAPNTTLTFAALGLRESGARVNTVAIGGGTAYVDVPKLNKGDEFTLQLPNRAVTLTHSVHFRIDMDGMEARIAVFHGQLDVPGSERAIDVRKGETLTVNFNDGDRYNLSNEVASLAFDAWDKDRDDILRDAGFNRNAQTYPYGYGYADLMNYGTFMNVGGYGSCWRPYGVGFDWDPFDYGYWSYYPGWGYTWVSGYPWGWAPYRYGGWNWANSTGWSWCPRVNNIYNWNTWNIVPVIVNAPPRWHPPNRPNPPQVNLPPIIPVGRRDPGPYRGGLISDKPNTGNGSTGGGVPSVPEERRGGRPGPIDRSGFSGGGGGTPPRGPTIVVVTPPNGESGDRERGRPPRQNRGIDLTPPNSGNPGGRGGSPNAGAPIQSPVPIMRAPRGGPVGDNSPRIDRSGPVGRSMDSSPNSGMPSRGMDSPHVSAPPPPSSPAMHSDGPRMSAPAPSGGGHNKPPSQ